MSNVIYSYLWRFACGLFFSLEDRNVKVCKACKTHQTISVITLVCQFSQIKKMVLIKGNEVRGTNEREYTHIFVYEVFTN